MCENLRTAEVCEILKQANLALTTMTQWSPQWSEAAYSEYDYG